MNTTNRPLWEHDCLKCTFLGTYDSYDLYYCPMGAPGRVPTVIARRGNETEAYASGIAVASIPLTDTALCMPALRIAYLIAKDLGLAD